MLSSFAELPFSEAMRFGVRFGDVRRPFGGGEPFVRTFASPLLAELGRRCPTPLPGDDWLAANPERQG